MLEKGILPSNSSLYMGTLNASIQDISFADKSAIQLSTLISKIKSTTLDPAVKLLINEFNEMEFQLSKHLSDDLIKTVPPHSFESTKNVHELEIVVEEQTEQINFLKMKVDECEELIQFGENDYAEMKKVVKEQEGIIHHLRDKIKVNENNRRLKQTTIESIIQLIKSHALGMPKEEASCWDDRLHELSESASRGDKKTSAQMKKLTVDLEEFQSNYFVNDS